MLKVKDFDYDLWTTVEDGVKHYWAKVRETGEITEISHEVMVYLRSEEKRIYREIETTRNEGTILSLDIPHDDEKESWFEDHGASKSHMETAVEEKEFIKTLTKKQLEIYNECMLGDCGVREFAERKKVDPTTISEAMETIRRKFTKYSYYNTPTNEQKMSVVG